MLYANTHFLPVQSQQQRQQMMPQTRKQHPTTTTPGITIRTINTITVTITWERERGERGDKADIIMYDVENVFYHECYNKRFH